MQRVFMICLCRFPGFQTNARNKNLIDIQKILEYSDFDAAGLAKGGKICLFINGLLKQKKAEG
ncbi:MAG: hypothetical protein DRH37_00515 [Deltaproteobacteria bacterium]|nr:MAG: hypothetical protein DRH37_00515 [Deltaproteobacteria bacterium]